MAAEVTQVSVIIRAGVALRTPGGAQAVGQDLSEYTTFRRVYQVADIATDARQ